MMQNCDDKFTDGRVLPDPRLKVTLDPDGVMGWRYQDMNEVTARECVRRLAHHMRMADMYESGLNIRKDERAGYMIEVTTYPDMPEKTICIAHHPKSGAIQAAVSGMSVFQATILCDSLAFEMDIKGLSFGATI
jgi:hypothetical protein